MKNALTREERQQILDRLLRVWDQFPELRLCQLIMNVSGKDPYYLRDEEIAAMCEDYAGKHAKAE